MSEKEAEVSIETSVASEKQGQHFNRRSQEYR